MRHTAHAAAALFGVVLLGQGPAISTPPGTPQPAAPSAEMERLRSTFGTQSSRSGCVRRWRNCTFRPCCDDRPCRENGDGDDICR